MRRSGELVSLRIRADGALAGQRGVILARVRVRWKSGTKAGGRESGGRSAGRKEEGDVCVCAVVESVGLGLVRGRVVVVSLFGGA